MTRRNDNPEAASAPQSSGRRHFLQQAGKVSATLALGKAATAATETATTAATETQDTSYPPAGKPESNMEQVNRARFHRHSTGTELPSLPLRNVGPDQIPRKLLGSTGVDVSIIGIGGFNLGQAASQEEATRIAHEAVDAGVNFMDNAWEYNNHRSEEWMGNALKGIRDKVFLMTKVCTHGRDANVGMQMLEESLKRLQTDHLDLWQIHEVVYYNDPELHFAPGGVVEALTKAKQQGKVRFVGFTGHKNPAIHLRMLALADQHGFRFDTVQMPLNCFDATFRSFEQQVLPEALKRGMGALGMKSLGGGAEPVLQGAVNVTDALRYAMSLPVATTISGIDSLEILRQNLAIARGFQPMTPHEMQALRDRCAAAAADGHLELYKTTKKYDADVGREQHGYPTPQELPL